MDDLKGMKFRTPPNQFHMDIFNALGAKSTPTAYGEIYTALQNKAIDGLENDLAGITSNKFYEVSKYMTLTGHFSWPVLLVISDKTWDKVPAEDRSIFEQAAQKALEANIQALVDGEAKHLQTLKDAGVEIIPLSEEQKAKFVEASKPIYEQYANTPEAKEYIDAVNKLKK
jgi:C4-dicarboxylate-binding protein DctP